jgi:uncharacterized protein (DUF2235 family)
VKNIVLCSDGTANEFARDRTNVVKLFYALDHNSPQQFAYYHPGLGTMEPPGALTAFGKGITKLLGKAIGYGLESDVRDAYVFLMNNFEPATEYFYLSSVGVHIPCAWWRPFSIYTACSQEATNRSYRMRFE